MKHVKKRPKLDWSSTYYSILSAYYKKDWEEILNVARRMGLHIKSEYNFTRDVLCQFEEIPLTQNGIVDLTTFVDMGVNTNSLSFMILCQLTKSYELRNWMSVKNILKRMKYLMDSNMLVKVPGKVGIRTVVTQINSLKDLKQHDKFVYIKVKKQKERFKGIGKEDTRVILDSTFLKYHMAKESKKDINVRITSMKIE